MRDRSWAAANMSSADDFILPGSCKGRFRFPQIGVVVQSHLGRIHTAFLEPVQSLDKGIPMYTVAEP